MSNSPQNPQSNQSSPYSPVDRSGLNLPDEHFCTHCKAHRSSSDFELKKRNQYTPEGHYELKDICVPCEKAIREVKNGVMLKALRAGERVASDRLIELVTANNNSQLDLILNQFVNLVTQSQDAADFRLFFNVIQGGNPIMHLSQTPPEKDNRSNEPISDPKALLGRLKKSDSSEDDK